jgi:PPOX class probable F420-dependent enzyme
MTLDVPGWATALLETARVARLGTADAGGQPLVLPVCYAFDGRACYSAVDAKPKRHGRLKRLRNIAENPRVSLAVDEYDEEWTRLRYVVLQGRAQILTAGAEVAHAADLLVAKYPQYRALPLDRVAGPVIKIVPERVLHWRYTAPDQEQGRSP